MARLTTNTDGVKDRAEFEVLWNRKSDPPKSVEVDGRNIPMGPVGFKVKDPGLAREIDARYGYEKGGDRSLMVVPVQSRPDPGTKRTFLVRMSPKLQENLRRARESDGKG